MPRSDGALFVAELAKSSGLGSGADPNSPRVRLQVGRCRSGSAGFGQAADPARRGYFLSVFVYRITDGWVICLGGGPEPFDAESARAALGSLVPGRDFAAFAQRLIQGRMSLAELAQRLERSLAETLPG